MGNGMIHGDAADSSSTLPPTGTNLCTTSSAVSFAQVQRRFIELTHALMVGLLPSRAVARNPPNDEAAIALVRMRLPALDDPPMPFFTKLEIPRRRSELLPDRTNPVKAPRAC